MNKQNITKKHTDIRRDKNVSEFMLVNTITESIIDTSDGFRGMIPNDLPRTFIMASVKKDDGKIINVCSMAKRFRDVDGYGTSHGNLMRILNEVLIKSDCKLLSVTFHGAIMVDERTKTINLINTDTHLKNAIPWDDMITAIGNGAPDMRSWAIECYANDMFDLSSRDRSKKVVHKSII